MKIDRVEIWRDTSLELILPKHLHELRWSPDIQLFKNITEDVYTLKLYPSLFIGGFIKSKSLYIPCKFKHGVFKLETRNENK